MSFTIRYDHLEGHAVDIVVSEMPLYGVERVLGVDDSLPELQLDELLFRLYDDDGELYYSGVLDDDAECENQSAALRWGEADAGCTTIKVQRDDEWVQEIG